MFEITKKINNFILQTDELISRGIISVGDKNAIFDFDGTLIVGDIEESFYCYLLSIGYRLPFSWQEYNDLLEKHQFEKAYIEIKKSFAGLKITEIRMRMEELLNLSKDKIVFEQNGKKYSFQKPKANSIMKKVVQLLMKNGFNIYVISASQEIIVKYAANRWFAIPEINSAGMRNGIEFINDDNYLTEEIVGITTIKEGKVELLRNILKINEPLLTAGDSVSDIEMMNTTSIYGIKILVGKNSFREVILSQLKNKDNLIIID